MEHRHLSRWYYCLVIVALLFSLGIDGKGFGGGRGGGGFKAGGSRSGGTFGGSSSSNFGRSNSLGNNMNRPRSGSGLKTAAVGFGAGALGGIAAYSIMSSMSSSYRSRPGYYEPGYGTGETCTNNQDINGTKFGTFRCPLNGFSKQEKYCCGDYGEQYCCERERSSSSRMPHASHFAWLFLIVLIVIVIYLLWARKRRERHKEIIMVPTEPPMFEQQGQPFYHPPQPPMGYPQPPGGNPYAVPPQNQGMGYNPYMQQNQMPYPNQQQPYNPYQAKEGGPPAYNDAVRRNEMPSSEKNPF